MGTTIVKTILTKKIAVSFMPTHGFRRVFLVMYGVEF